jgi:FdhD protein
MINQYMGQTELLVTSASVKCHKLTNGHFHEAEARVVTEKELPILINGKHLATASVTPAMAREFIIGYLFGQGFIENIEELESIDVAGDAARVTVKDDRKLTQIMEKSDHRIVSGGGQTVFFNEMSLPRIASRITIARKEIFKAMNMVLEKARIYQETEGVHAAGLFTPEATPIYIIEDIGRHNTLDKVIGHALINEIDCKSTFLASTGRLASEMVTKICRAQIPVVATKTAITKAGLDIGQKCGLTIIGFVRDAGTRINTDMEVITIKEPGMKIYTNAQRIL